MEEHQIVEAGGKGFTLEGRNQFKQFVSLATSGNAPFDGIIAKHMSSFGRQILGAGVFLYLADPGIDSRDFNNDPLFAVADIGPKTTGCTFSESRRLRPSDHI